MRLATLTLAVHTQVIVMVPVSGLFTKLRPKDAVESNKIIEHRNQELVMGIYMSICISEFEYMYYSCYMNRIHQLFSVCLLFGAVQEL